ncbi:MAG TPA: hypothetical protein ENL07_10105 [Chlorobaculum parvum]|uniref:Type II secretion system protein n=1 Tax=Chlorobaculum parvum TaxID=274539 RepID=A0A7C5DGG9_9CHLB|nr:hypothetical protein [Chlorobaculum parvum]
MKPVGKDGVLGIVVSLLVVAAVVRGLFMIGPIDEQRLSDLQRIVSSVEFYYRTHQELPENLDVLAKQPASRVPLFDPESGKPYGYRRLSPNTYELCATFALESDESTALRWSHKSGQACFRLSVRR